MKSKRFQENAQDIFITNNNYNWNRLPNMIVGKLGYDPPNFIIDDSFHDKNTSIINIEKTLKIFHVSNDISGKHVENERDAYINHRIAKTIRANPFDHGSIKLASDYYTEKNMLKKRNGEILYIVKDLNKYETRYSPSGGNLLSGEWLLKNDDLTNHIEFNTRDDLGKILEKQKFHVGVELGVQRGLFSATILAQWQSCTKYVLVDLWEKQKNYNDVANNANHVAFMEETARRMEPFKQKGVDVEICRNYTTSCVERYADGTFDFIYVDARHDFKGVYLDITEWWRKLRIGGIMAGHDYVTQDEGPEQTHQDWTKNYDGTVDHTRSVVKGAVNKFAKENGLIVNTGLKEEQKWPRKGPWPSWVIRKTRSSYHVDLNYVSPSATKKQRIRRF